MDELAIILSSFGGTLILIIFAGLTIFVVKSQKIEFDESDFNGMSPFEIDLVNRRVRKILMVNDFNATNNLLNFYNYHEGSWLSLEEFLDFFTKKSKMQLTNYLNKKHKKKSFYSNIIFKSKYLLTKEKDLPNYNFYIELNKEVSKEWVYGNISWNICKKQKTITEKLEKISRNTKDELISFNEKFLGVVGFQLQEFSPNNSLLFLNELINKIYFTQQKTFFYRNSFIILFTSNSKEKMKAKVKNFLETIKKVKIHVSMPFFVKKIGIVESKKITTYQDLENIFTRLDFIYSKKTNKNKVRRFSLDKMDFTDYEIFNHEFNNFNKTLSSREIDYSLIDFKKIDSGKSITFKFTKIISDIQENSFTNIIKNKKRKLKLYDTFFLQKINVLKNKKVVLDLSFNAFKVYFKKIQKTIIIPIINFYKDDEIYEFIKLYKKFGPFNFGIRITKIDNNILNLIGAIQNCILFIDEIISSKINHAKTQIDLITIKEIIKFRKILLIYQNPDLKISHKLRVSIGLRNYFVTTKK